MLLYLALASSLASGLAASIAWWVKLRWADEYKAATEQAAKAKEAEIAALRTQVEILQSIHPTKLLEDAASTKSGLESIISRIEEERDAALSEIEQQRESANLEIADLRAKLDSLPSTSEVSGHSLQLQAEKRVLRDQLTTSTREERMLRARAVRLRATIIAQRIRDYEQQIYLLQAQGAAIQSVLNEERAKWLDEQRDARLRMESYKDRSDELRIQINEIQTIGERAICPTCGQGVRDVLPRLLEELQDQWIVLGQDEKWWKQKYEQLQTEPDRVSELGEHLRVLKMRIGDATMIRDELAGRSAELQDALEQLEQEEDSDTLSRNAPAG